MVPIVDVVPEFSVVITGKVVNLGSTSQTLAGVVHGRPWVAHKDPEGMRVPKHGSPSLFWAF